MISQRTFFNYVGSKEGAILGTASPWRVARARCSPSRERTTSQR
jgi:hypothetical protein